MEGEKNEEEVNDRDMEKIERFQDFFFQFFIT